MPIYEYRCVEDGDLIEVIRPMADADKPVDDPKGKGRTFERVHSTFAVSGSPTTTPAHQHKPGGGCGCGNPHGPCGR
jgi:putative FmdB family regulatory protein